MIPESSRPWHKKKRYLIPIGVATLLFFMGDSSQVQKIEQTTPVVQKVQSASYSTNTNASQISDTTQPVKSLIPTGDGLSNANYYTNAQGNQVHSPAYSSSIPSGASAQCRDGTYSFSQSRRGTCSRHGGVASWLY